MVRARAVIDLADALDAEIEERNGTSLLYGVELPLLRTLARMEQTGVAVDVDHLEALESEFGAKVNQAADEAYAVLGKQINLGSPKQLQVVLFDELGMPKTRRTRTGYTTDADALQSLYVKTEHPFLAHLLVHRDAIRLKQTVEGLLKSVADDGRIHTTYGQTIAATGRLSSTDPNLQNIPIRTEEGRRIRQAFVVGRGVRGADVGRLLPDRDADHGPRQRRRRPDRGVQVRHGLPHGHGVPGLRGGAGRRSSPAERAKIKAMNYGLAYGLSAFGLSQQLTIDTSEAKALMDEYFERFGGVRDYLRSLVVDARRTEYTETILGRRRYLPDLMSDNRQRREMAERMALNAPIQGSAADIIKVAMLDVEKALDDAGMRSRMLLQVHDELVFEIGARGAGGADRPGPGQDGPRRGAGGAAGRLGRSRPLLARGRPLSARSATFAADQLEASSTVSGRFRTAGRRPRAAVKDQPFAAVCHQPSAAAQERRIVERRRRCSAGTSVQMCRSAIAEADLDPPRRTSSKPQRLVRRTRSPPRSGLSKQP